MNLSSLFLPGRPWIWAVLVLLVGPTIGSAELPFVVPASAPVPGIIDIGNRRQNFLDDRVIHEASKLSKFMPRPTKYAKNPILVADRPWEQGSSQGSTPQDVSATSASSSGVIISGSAVLYDEEEKIFKMWYNPAVWADGRHAWCYATSKDGYTWEKPNLGIYEFQGSKENNILADWADPCFDTVLKDPREKDPARRYKALGEIEGPIANHTGGVAVAFSPDGLHWTPYAGNPVLHHGPDIADAPTILGWDPKREKFVGYFRPGHPVGGEIYGDGDHRHIRAYGYSESADFVTWTHTRPMLAPDAEDRADAQYMQLTGGIDGEFYIGFNAIYLTHEQTWDIMLMSSRDGFRWNWIDRHVPFLPRGEVGSYDAGYITPSGPIFHDGKVWIYYGAFSGAHSYNLTKLGHNRLTVALCTLPENRWMGLLAGPQRATLVTRPLLFTGSKLFVDLDASVPMQEPRLPRRFDECVLRAALEDQSGGAIAGFSLNRSTVVTKGGVQEISWAGADLAALAGKPVRLRFELRNATLYSFQFQ